MPEPKTKSSFVSSIFDSTDALRDFELKNIKQKANFNLDQVTDKILGMRQLEQVESLKAGIDKDVLTFESSLLEKSQAGATDFSSMVNDFESQVVGKYDSAIKSLTDKKQSTALELGLERMLLGLKRKAVKMDFDAEIKRTSQREEKSLEGFQEALVSGNEQLINDREQGLYEFYQALKAQGIITNPEYKAKIKDMERLKQDQTMKDIVTESYRTELISGGLSAYRELKGISPTTIKKLGPSALKLLMDRLAPLEKEVKKTVKEGLADNKAFLKAELKNENDILQASEKNTLNGTEPINNHTDRLSSAIDTAKNLLPYSKAGERKSLKQEINKRKAEKVLFSLLERDASVFMLFKEGANTERNRNELFPNYTSLPESVKVEFAKGITKLTESFNNYKDPKDIQQFLSWVDRSGAGINPVYQKMRDDNLKEARAVLVKVFDQDSEEIMQASKGLADIATTSQIYKRLNKGSELGISDSQKEAVVGFLSNMLEKFGSPVGFIGLMNYFTSKNVYLGPVFSEGITAGNKNFFDQVSTILRVEDPVLTKHYGSAVQLLHKKDKNFEIHLKKTEAALQEWESGQNNWFSDFNYDGISLNNSAGRRLLALSLAGKTYGSMGDIPYSAEGIEKLIQDDVFQKLMHNRTKISDNLYITPDENKIWVSKVFGVNIGGDARRNKNTATGQVKQVTDTNTGLDMSILHGSLSGDAQMGFFSYAQKTPLQIFGRSTLSSRQVSQVLFGLLNATQSYTHVSDLKNNIVIDADGVIYRKNPKTEELRPFKFTNRDGNQNTVSLNKEKFRELISNKKIKGSFFRASAEEVNFDMDELLGVFNNMPEDLKTKIKNGDYKKITDVLYRPGVKGILSDLFSSDSYLQR